VYLTIAILILAIWTETTSAGRPSKNMEEALKELKAAEDLIEKLNASLRLMDTYLNVAGLTSGDGSDGQIPVPNNKSGCACNWDYADVCKVASADNGRKFCYVLSPDQCPDAKLSEDGVRWWSYDACKDCYKATTKGKDYRGEVSVTISGKTCQAWNQQSPQTHPLYTEENKQESGLGEHNYCRNVGGHSDGVWCYTTDTNKRWDYCPVPSCGEKCAGKGKHKKQCVDVTINGKKFLKTSCIKGGAFSHDQPWCATEAPYNKRNGWDWNCTDC